MHNYNVILFSLTGAYFAFTGKFIVSQTTETYQEYYCYRCTGLKSNSICLNRTPVKCNVNQSCSSSYDVKPTGHMYGLTKGCVNKCTNPKAMVRHGRKGRRYCCFGNFCNQQLQFYEPDGLRPNVTLPDIDTDETTEAATNTVSDDVTAGEIGDATTETVTGEATTTSLLISLTQEALNNLIAQALQAILAGLGFSVSSA